MKCDKDSTQLDAGIVSEFPSKRFAILILVLSIPSFAIAGCSESAPPFQSDLQSFSKDARKLFNQIEMGMPETDQDRQAAELRDHLAGLNPESSRREGKA